MLQARSKFSLKYLSILILCSGALPILTLSKDSHFRYRNEVDNRRIYDTVILPKTSDTTQKVSKVDTLNVKISKDSISTPIDHKAEDSMVLEIDTKKIFLFGKTEIKYEDVTLNAPKIEFDQATQFVTAKMGRDTAGNVAGMAKLKQGETVTVSDSLRFNFKSQKGLTYNSFFQQDELFN